MIWQDLVLMLGGFVFSAALLPTIWSQSKPAASTCILTGSMLLVFAVVYLSLQLWLAAAATALSAACWLVLLGQLLTRCRRYNR